MDTTTQSNTPTQEPSETISQKTDIGLVIKSLRTLIDGDEQEQQETFAYLKHALDEDRPSNRRLFP